jgi:hypothetical protein
LKLEHFGLKPKALGLELEHFEMANTFSQKYFAIWSANFCFFAFKFSLKHSRQPGCAAATEGLGHKI